MTLQILVVVIEFHVCIKTLSTLQNGLWIKRVSEKRINATGKHSTNFKLLLVLTEAMYAYSSDGLRHKFSTEPVIDGHV